MANENIKGKDEGVKTCRWVKASDSPKSDGVYVILFTEPSGAKIPYNLEYVREAGGWNTTQPLETFEWLEEINVDREEGWIACEERLPENNDAWFNDRVMFVAAGIVRIGNYDYELGEWNDDGGGIYKNTTHWKPLPSPPINNKS